MHIGGRVGPRSHAGRALKRFIGRPGQQMIEAEIGARRMLVGLLRANLLKAKHIGVERREERQQGGAPGGEFRLTPCGPFEILKIKSGEPNIHDVIVARALAARQ